MGSLRQFRRDNSKAIEGVWVGKGIFDANPDGTVPEFLLGAAHKSNPKYQHAVIKWRRKNRRMYTSQAVDVQTEVEKMTRYGLINGCVFSWRNFQDDDNKNIPFDFPAVKYYLTEFPELADVLLELAQEKATFLDEEVEDIKGE